MEEKKGRAYFALLDKTGRVSIPKKARLDSGIMPGDQLSVSWEHGTDEDAPVTLTLIPPGSTVRSLFILTIDETGRFFLPENIRRYMGWTPGNYMRFTPVLLAYKLEVSQVTDVM